ncbi:hypothetical protein ACNHUS_35320 [Actinomycetes bacterium M1A6_2h]
MTSTRSEAAESDWQSSLFTSCAVPGCAVPVATPADVCTSCRTAFGEMLHSFDLAERGTESAAVAAQLAERDADVLAAYRSRRGNATAFLADSEPRRGQICWLCEQRRTCTKEAGGLECADCRDAPR